MSSSDVFEVEGWTVQPKQVRQMATRVGIPSELPLPEVIVVDRTVDEYFKEQPQINESLSGTSSSGFFITLPERYLEWVGKEDYILGSRARENIRHELAHYLGYLEGEYVGQEKDPYVHAVKEIKADLRAGVGNLSLSLVRQSCGLRNDYGLSDRKSFSIVAKAARSLGVSSRVISRARKMVSELG